MILSFLFGANPQNTSNKSIFKKANTLIKQYSHTVECCLIEQTEQGQVTLSYKGVTKKHTELSPKTCLSSKQVIEKALDLLAEVKLSTNRCRFYVVTHEDHTWPKSILKKQGLNVTQKTGTTRYAGSDEPQSRCRSQFLFFIYRALVLIHHKLKGWI